MPLLQSNVVEGSGNEYKLTIVYILKKKISWFFKINN